MKAEYIFPTGSQSKYDPHRLAAPSYVYGTCKCLANLKDTAMLSLTNFVTV